MEIEWKVLFKEYETGPKDKVLKKIDSFTSKVINKADKKGDLALILSCKRGIFELASLFIKKGAQVDIQDSKDGAFSPLLYACERNSIDLVGLLLENGANLNQANEEGLSALHIASEYGHYELAKILIEKGADINLKNLNEKTALYLACEANQLEMVKLLLEKKADSNGMSSDSDFFFYQPYNEEIILYLFNNSATFLNDPEKTNSSYKILFEKACRFGHNNLIEYLMENKGVKLSELEMDEITPLYGAFQAEQLETAEFLIKKGANLNSADKCQDPVLYSALREERLELVKLVVENGASLVDRNVSYLEYVKSQANKEIYIFLSVYVIGEFYNLIFASNFESTLAESIQTFETEKHFFLLSKECLEAVKVLLKYSDLGLKTTINEHVLKSFKMFLESIDSVSETLNKLVLTNSMRQLSLLETISRKIRIQCPDLNIETIVQKLSQEVVTEELNENGEIKITSYLDITSLNLNGRLYELIDTEKTKESKLNKAYSYYRSIREFMSKNRERHTLIQELIKFLTDHKGNLVKYSNKILEDNQKMHTDASQQNKSNKPDLDLFRHVNNPLIIAAENKRFELTESLVNKSIKTKEELMNLCGRDQMPLLFILCRNGAPELVKRLIEKYKVNVNIQIADGSTLLHLAILQSQSKLVEYLIQCGANLALKNNSGETCLSLACQQGSMNFAKLLVSKGADKNSQDNRGDTSVMRALYAESGDEIAEFLIKNGANVNLLDKNGESALLKVCEQTRPAKLALLLIEKGADINCSDRNGKTCLVEACKNYDYDSVIDTMVQRGVKIKQALSNDGNMTTIVDYLKRSNNTKLTNLLMKSINVNEKNQDGSTLLHIACECAHVKLVKMLIEKDADINALNKQHQTPLHKCCMTNYLINSQESKHVEIAKLLISKEADLSIRNESGQSYLGLVCSEDLAYDTEKDLNELKKIFRNAAIKSLHVAFNYKDVSVFRQKVIESINNKDTDSFVLSWDHVQAFKLLRLDSEGRSANDFDAANTLEYFVGFEFKERLLEDVLNNLKAEKESLDTARAKINQGFSELDDIQSDLTLMDGNNQYDYFELKQMIAEQDLINLVLAEKSVSDKLRKKMQLLNNIDQFLLKIEERIVLAKTIFEMINQENFLTKQA